MKYLLSASFYQNDENLFELIVVLLEKKFPVLVVLDGSPASLVLKFYELSEKFPKQLFLIHHACHIGKAESIMTAFSFSLRKDINYLVTIDNRTLVNEEDIRQFVEIFNGQVALHTLYLGERDLENNADNQPFQHMKTRNLFSLFLKTFSGSSFSDAFSPLRAYPVSNMIKIVKETKQNDFDLEVLVRSVSAGISIQKVFLNKKQTNLRSREVVIKKRSVMRWIGFFLFLTVFKATRPLKSILNRK